MNFALAVNAPVPTRSDAGRCADRYSPNADELFRLAVARVTREPALFPIREPVSVVVTSADPLPNLSGYTATDAMVEVLVDAGVLLDERLVATERFELHPGVAGYSVVVSPLPRQ